MDDDLRFDRDGRVTFADGTPLPAEAEVSGRWQVLMNAVWQDCTYIEALFHSGQHPVRQALSAAHVRPF